MFKKILIANRGEIALRIIRACKELGIKTVVVYSQADQMSLPVKYADEAICIGPAEVEKSYLNIPNIISSALMLGVDAIHPGYGFLSENPNFAQICKECNITFIGPSPEVLKLLGDKAKAREIAKSLGIPVLEGTSKISDEEGQIIRKSEEIGYPLIIKTSNGGGGKGIRIVSQYSELKEALSKIKPEAEISFGNSEVYLEKYLENPRHIEVQVIADNYQNMIFLTERDCSLQRRHQKLLEESPAVGVDEKLRISLGTNAINLLKKVNYTNCGTVEFLIDKNKNFYFLEVNPRIQVEHPVTEYVMGIDLIKKQIEIAAGEKLRITQEQTRPRGHALQCRINAEDPLNNFLPFPGRIKKLHLPGGNGIRIDTHLYQDYTVPSQYDSLIAKVITWGKDREEAIFRMKRTLEEIEIEGIKTTIPFFHKILENEEFLRGEMNTEFIQKNLNLLLQ